MSFLKYRLLKSYEVLPYFLTHPRRIPALFKGATPARLASLDVPWLREMNIRSVIDVGANVGQFASIAHQILPDAAIHSFEPLEDCYEALNRRMEAVSGFRSYNLALGDRDAHVSFQRNTFTQSSSVLPNTSLQSQAFAWTAETSTVTVPMARLDTVMEDVALAPNLLIKIDVEGIEDRVLRGGERTMRRAWVAIIEASFEALHEGQALFADVYDLMLQYGFRYAGNLDQLLSPADGRVLQADAVFLNARAR